MDLLHANMILNNIKQGQLPMHVKGNLVHMDKKYDTDSPTYDVAH